MKTIVLCVAAAATLAATAPAVAQHYTNGWMSINQRQEMLDRRIDMGVRSGRLTRAEAMRLRSDFRQIARMEVAYRRDGLQGWERADLDRRFDRLSYQIRDQTTDRDRRYTYNYR